MTSAKPSCFASSKMFLRLPSQVIMIRQGTGHRHVSAQQFTAGRIETIMRRHLEARSGDAIGNHICVLPCLEMQAAIEYRDAIALGTQIAATPWRPAHMPRYVTSTTARFWARFLLVLYSLWKGFILGVNRPEVGFSAKFGSTRRRCL